MTAVPSRVTSASSAHSQRLLNRIREAALWVLVGLLVAIFAAGIVAGIALGSAATSTMLLDWTTATIAPILASWGLPAGSVVAYLLLLEIGTFGLGLVAVWLLLRRPWSGFRVYVAVVLLLHVTVGGSAALLLGAAVPALSWTVALSGLGWFGLFSLLLVFPDGRFVPRWTRWTVPAWIAVFVGFLTLDPNKSPPALPALALLALLVIGVVAQVLRYRGEAGSMTREQTQWVLAMLLARVGFVVVIGIVGLVQPDTAPSAAALVVELAGMGVSYLVSALLVLSIAVAVVRHRLFGAEVVASRAVVYGALTVFVLLLYGLLVGVVGLVWPSGGVVLPVLATAAAAASLVPVRTWLQRRVARLVYGDRAEPYRVVSELGERLAATARPEDLVQTLVQSVGSALGLRRVAVVLVGLPHPVATYVDHTATRSDGTAESFPIDHQGRRVGTLEVAPQRTEPLTGDDRALLRSVAGQAGLAVAAAQASAEVEVARNEAIAAREEERRRLHRDLHDGLGPTLASLYQRVDLAGRLVDSDPPASRRLLAVAGDQIRETVADVRRLVYALRPPRLDDLGLVEALRLATEELPGAGSPDFAIRCPQPLPALPAVIETTAYRIVLESVTNVVRHARADNCTVDLVISGSSLVVTVQDDGVGLPTPVPPGAGLRSVRDRVAEVGGCVETATAVPHGTILRARLPLGGEQVG
ncbi:MAG TPA: sensor histidine kinase [Microlunatus sp.]|nr:sensor histidine kinase [Microlunatus sp.]